MGQVFTRSLKPPLTWSLSQRQKIKATIPGKAVSWDCRARQESLCSLGRVTLLLCACFPGGRQAWNSLSGPTPEVEQTSVEGRNAGEEVLHIQAHREKRPEPVADDPVPEPLGKGNRYSKSGFRKARCYVKATSNLLPTFLQRFLSPLSLTPLLSLSPHFGHLPASLCRNRLIFSFIRSTNIHLVFIIMKIAWYSIQNTLDFIIIIIIFFHVRCRAHSSPVNQALP